MLLANNNARAPRPARLASGSLAGRIVRLADPVVAAGSASGSPSGSASGNSLVTGGSPAHPLRETQEVTANVKEPI